MSAADELWLKRARRLQTEEEWRSWEFLNPLIRLIDPARVGDRKPRLFTAACIRRLWGSPYLGAHGGVAEALERQADVPPTAAEHLTVVAALREVRLRCTEVMGGMYWQASIDYPEEPQTDPWRVAWGTADAAIIAAGCQVRVAASLLDDRPEHEHRAAEESAVCELVRCVFGNPFRPVTVDPAWRTSTVTSLVQAAYEERILPGVELDAQRLAILADALEEAGCTNEEILVHLRDPGPHVRGCWALDRLLARE
jgi:hypothetical protein